MDINNLNREDIYHYMYDGEWSLGKSKHNTYLEEWTLPAEASEFECHGTYHHPKWENTSSMHIGCCNCGCGDIVHNWYAPGHDQKHYGKLIRQWQQADVKEAMQLIRDAQDNTTQGVWCKFMDRAGFGIHHTADGRVVATGASRDLVIKVGRWYYPVIKHPTRLQFYRSTKTIGDRLFDNHEFTIKVDIEDVTSLTDLRIAQEKAGA